MIVITPRNLAGMSGVTMISIEQPPYQQTSALRYLIIQLLFRDVSDVNDFNNCFGMIINIADMQNS